MTAAPLYREVRESRHRTCQANRGLEADKFFAGWDPDRGWALPGGGGDASAKADWVAAFDGQRVGDTALLAEHVERLEREVQARGGRVLYLLAERPFVSGLGRAHPIENGFCWNHVLGVPCLAGSGLKGVLRGWAWESGTEQIDAARLFGPAAQAGEPSQGVVIVRDAVPVTRPTLRAEVMTPHYGPWYKGETACPGDWFSPVPIPYLAVAPGAVFATALIPTARGGERDLDEMQRLMEEALAEAGAGAKTAVGQGRFQVGPDRKKIESQARELLASKMPAMPSGHGAWSGLAPDRDGAPGTSGEPTAHQPVRIGTAARLQPGSRAWMDISGEWFEVEILRLVGRKGAVARPLDPDLAAEEPDIEVEDVAQLQIKG